MYYCIKCCLVVESDQLCNLFYRSKTSVNGEMLQNIKCKKCFESEK